MSPAAPRRAAGLASAATALIVAAAMVRLLTLRLPLARELGVAGLGLAALVQAVWRLRPEPAARTARDLLAVVRTALLAGTAIGLVVLAGGDAGDLHATAILLAAAVQLSIPATVRVRGVLAATAIAEGALCATWLVWLHGDVLTLLVVVGGLCGLWLVLAAQAVALGANSDTEAIRTSAHAATAERVGTSIDVPAVTRAVLETTRDTYPLTSQALVFLYDVPADRLRPLPLYLGRDGVRTMDADLTEVAVAPGEGLAGIVFSAGEAMLWPTAADVHAAEAAGNDQARSQVASLRDAAPLSAVGAPLVVDGQPIGAFVLTTHRQELAWDDADLTIVSALAGEAARAIERARRYERELDQAHLDSITGLANHRQLTRTLDQEVARARRLETHLGVVFCDLDRFKAVNDTYGHDAGNRVLTTLAHVFRDLLRREDSAARYGGDEFVCVLPGADHAEAAAVGVRIASSFEQRVREDTELRQAGVTISCGVAIFPDDATDADSLLQHADAAMRAVKEGRRSGVTARWRGG